MRTGNGYHEPAGHRQNDEIDLRNLAGALWRSRFKVIIPALFLAVATLFIVGRMTPYYRSEARILIEVGENVYTRPTGVEREQREVIDEQAIQSQVQLVLSRSVALAVAEKAGLMQKPDFDPLASGLSVPKWFMTVFGLIRDPRRMSVEERVLDTYYQGLTVYPVMRSRVIAIQFSSSNPKTAAEIANLVAEEYLRQQQSTKQDTTRDASVWLGREIEELRKKVADAEGKVETFRAQTNLFMGANNATLATQQLGELNTQLTAARGALAEAQAKRQLIRDLIKGRGAYESLDVANAELIRRLAEQRVMLRATIAREGRTLLPAHPRMKELTAQLANLDEQVEQEAQVIARGIENDVKVATTRADTLEKSIEAQKKVASVANEQDVQLRALEREAKAQRDLLEQFLTRYREASSRERPEAALADARIISRASESNTPYFPKPLPIVILAFFGTLALAMALVVAAELLTEREPVYTPVPPRPYSPDDDGSGSRFRSYSADYNSGDRPAHQEPSSQRASYRAETTQEPSFAELEERAYGSEEQPAPVHASDVSSSADTRAEAERSRGERPQASRTHVAPVISTSDIQNGTSLAPLPEKFVGAKSELVQTQNAGIGKVYGIQSAVQSAVATVQKELRLGRTDDVPVSSDDSSLENRLNRIMQKTSYEPEQKEHSVLQQDVPSVQQDEPLDEPVLDLPVAEPVHDPVSALNTEPAVEDLHDNVDTAEPAATEELAHFENVSDDEKRVVKREAPVVEISTPAPVQQPKPAAPALDADSLSAFEKVKADLMERISSQAYVAPHQQAQNTPAGEPSVENAVTSSAQPMKIEAADAQMVDALATRLAAMPRDLEALSILVVGTDDSVDSGQVALKLGRALAHADRKTVLLDTGVNSADITAAIAENAPSGFTDLIADKISFSNAIHDDRASPAHVIPLGTVSLEDKRKNAGMEVVFGALGFTYDFIVVAGSSCAQEESIRFMANRCAAAILVSHGQTSDAATMKAYDLLQRNGIQDVVVLLAQSPASSAMSRLPASIGARSA